MNIIYLLFNKQGIFQMFMEDISGIPADMFLIKEMSFEEPFNLARYRWEGDYTTGRMVDLFEEKKAIVTQEEIDNKYYGIFFRKYDLPKAIFNIMEHFAYNTNESLGMMEFYKKLNDKKKEEIEFYKNSPNHIFQSNDDQEENFNKTFSK